MLHRFVCWYVKCVEKVPFRKSGHKPWSTAKCQKLKTTSNVQLHAPVTLQYGSFKWFNSTLDLFLNLNSCVSIVNICTWYHYW